MTTELYFDQKKYISVKDASLLTGYTRDYIGQLSRSAKIESKKIGDLWYVSEESVLRYRPNTSHFLEEVSKSSETTLETTTSRSADIVSEGAKPLGFIPSASLNPKIKHHFASGPNSVTKVLVASVFVVAVSFGVLSVKDHDLKSLAQSTTLSKQAFVQSAENITDFVLNKIVDPIKNGGQLVYENLKGLLGTSLADLTANVFISENPTSQNNPTTTTYTTTSTTTPTGNQNTTQQISNGSAIINQNITNPVVEKTIQVISPAQLTSEDLENRLQQFSNKVNSDVFTRLANLSTGGVGNGNPISNVYQQIAHTNRIDQLSSVDISNSNITGSTITNSSISATTLTATSFSVPTITFSGVAINSLLSTNSSGIIVATSTPTFGNFNATSTTATSTISTGGFAVGNNHFIVQQNSGNVGIGNITASNVLSVGDDLNNLDVKTISIGNTVGHSSLMLGQDGGSNFGYLRWNYDATPSNSYLSLQTANNQNIALAPAGGRVGIGTTTPWAQLSVNPNGITGPSFVVGSSTATDFIVDNAGRVAIGTTTASQALNIQSGGINFNGVGTAPAATASLAGLGAGNLGNGTYTYRVAFVTTSGESATNNSNTLTVLDNATDGQISLTIPVSTDRRVIARHIYRTVSGAPAGGFKFFLTRIDNNTDTTYIDNIPDSSLNLKRNAAQSYDFTSGGIFSNGKLIGSIGQYPGDFGPSLILGRFGETNSWNGLLSQYGTAGGGNLALTGPNSRISIFATSTTLSSRIQIVNIEDLISDPVGTTLIRDRATWFTTIPSAAANTSLVNIPHSGVFSADAGLSGGMILASQATTGPMILTTGGSAYANERMRILNTGYIGIGTTTPQYLLTIASSTAPQLSLSAGAGISQWTMRNAGGNLYFATTTVDGTATTTTSTLSILGNGNVGIGTTTPNNTIQVVDLINFNNSISSTFLGFESGKNIDTSISGTSVFVGYRAGLGASASRTLTNVGVGYEALSSYTDVAESVAIGHRALKNSNGWYNVAIGSNALLNSTTGGTNVAIGADAMRSTLGGSGNVAIGNEAGYTGTSATSNSLVGISALRSNVSGSENAIVGNHAFSTAVSVSATAAVGSWMGYGSPAAQTIVGGAFLGYYSANSIQTGGNYNTFLGYKSGHSMTTGAYNILLGQNIDAPVITGSQQLNIGNILYGTGVYNGGSASSEPVVGGKIGISTTTPWATLSLNSTGGTGAAFAIGSSTSNSFIVTNTGRVGIGITNPSEALTVGSGQKLLLNSPANDYPHTIYTDSNANLIFKGQSQLNLLLVSTNTELNNGGGGVLYWNGTNLHLTGQDTTSIIFGRRGDGAYANTVDVRFGQIMGSNIFMGVGNQGVVTLTADGNQDDVLIRRHVTGAYTESGSLLRLEKNITGSSTYNSNYLEWGTTAVDLGVINKDGYLGVGTTTPWRTLSVTGTVGFDGLTAAVGAGSLCLSANKELVYNAGTDACLASLRSTKHDIQNLTLNALDTLNQLQSVSFIYNEGDGRTRYGFIAEDTSVVDDNLATHNALGELSGIDDRAIISLTVKAVQELNLSTNSRLTNLEQIIASSTPSSGGITFAGVLDEFVAQFETVGAKFQNGIAYFKNIFTDKLTVGTSSKPTGVTLYDPNGDVYCVSLQVGGALVSTAGECGEQGGNDQGPIPNNQGGEEGGNDTMTNDPTDTIPPVITLNGGATLQIPLDSAYSDLGATVTDLDNENNVNNNLGIYFNVNGIDVQSVQLDTATTTIHTIVYSAMDEAGNFGYATRTVEVIEEEI